MATKLAATVGNMAGPVVPNVPFALDQVIETKVDSTFMGLLIVGVTEDSACGVWRVENGGGATVSANALFTNTKDSAGKYNVYFEGGYLKVQNKVAEAKTLRISVFGLEAATE